MSKVSLVAIDHGNSNIKTKNYVFPAGVVECGHMLTLGNQDVLVYRGKEYILVSKRMTQRNDKTTDDGHFILTLFAIGKELMHNNSNAVNEQGKIVRIKLAVGLPPGYIKEGAVKFAEYLKRPGQVEFVLNGVQFCIELVDVRVFPQAYAAARTVFNKLKDIPFVNVVDIGGYTVDCIRLENFAPDGLVLTSLPHGVDVLFARINEKVRAKMAKEVPDAVIEGVLLDDEKTLKNTSQERIDLILNEAKPFTKELLLTVSRTGLDLEEDTTLFIGGGALLLQRFITEVAMVKKPIFAKSVHANARGYEIIYRAMTKKS